MNRTLPLLALALLTSTAHASLTWQNLWSTPDQRGTQLMKQGNPRAAVTVFSDPKRKAYAELVSGDYVNAAKDYKPFNDGDANYNRGNALAHTGDLTGAIKAYDAALAQDPHNQDARHNRNLVEQQLKKQARNPQANQTGQHKPSAQSNKGKGAADQPAPPDNSPNPASSGKNNQTGKDQAGKNESGSQADGKGNPSNKSGTETGKSTPGSDQNKQERQTGQGQAGQQSGSAEPATNSGSEQLPGNGAQTANNQTGQSNGPGEKQQAAQDAASGVASLQSGTGPGAGTGTGSAPGNDKPPGAVESAEAQEKRMAQEQWLRNIPDDPGGLLRRKLLIEHMIRQQKEQP